MSQLTTISISTAKVIAVTFACFALACGLSGCFTGIESTPKIVYKPSDKTDTALAAEKAFAADFRSDPPAEWRPGKRFLVTDDKAQLSYIPLRPSGKAPVAGAVLVYTGIRDVPAITGGMAAEMMFANGTDTLLYRPGTDRETLESRRSVKLPFVVDLDLVQLVSGKMLGKTFWTRTDRWLADGGGEMRGRKFLKVQVDSVQPGSEVYPILLSFRSAEGTDERGKLTMAAVADDENHGLRGFENLFLLSDPRELYADISETHWQLIRRGKVAEGMTSREAQLALGSPLTIDRRNDQSMRYERWGYSDGVYLIFEEGILVRFNL